MPPTLTKPRPTRFTVKPWTGENEGEKIVLYGPSGAGKTTAASMLPTPLFIGLDDGGRKIRDPRTGNPIDVIEGIEDFDDVRAALQDHSLFANHESAVIDTVTKLESLIEAWVIRNVKTDKGASVKNLEGFGFGKGYKHMLDSFRLILQDLDALVRIGKNICLICQNSDVKVSNPENEDYIQAGPKLAHNNQHSSRLEVIEYADHVVRIGPLKFQVLKGESDRAAKVISEESERAMFTQGAGWFFAKTRTLNAPVISFKTPDDDSLWRLMFGEDE